MTYQVRTILRRTLPITYWLLAVGGCIAVPLFLWSSPANYWWGFLVAVLVMLVIWDLSHLDRHESSAQENFTMALLLGVASYWMPTVVFLNVPCWIFAMTRFAFRFRSFLGTFLGFMTVAIYAAIAIYLGWIDNVWADFFNHDYLWGWIPVAAIFTAWLATYYTIKALKDR